MDPDVFEDAENNLSAYSLQKVEGKPNNLDNLIINFNYPAQLPVQCHNHDDYDSTI